MNRMSRMFAQWIDMSLSPSSTNESSLSDRGDVPGPYRHRRRRRMVPPPLPTHHDGASPSTSSSATSSNDSFQLFDSDSNETEVEEGEGERGEERGGSESREHLTALDSKEDIFPMAMQSPNGSNVKSEGVVTMDVSTASERSTPPSPEQPKDGEKKALPSPMTLQNTDERCHAKTDTSSVVDTEARFTLSDGETENPNDSKDCKHDFQTWDSSRPMHESESEQSTRVEGSVASNVTVTIESRTKNSSPNSAPAVVVEGETDSDDTCEEGGSCDESHDSQMKSRDNGLLCSQYL